MGKRDIAIIPLNVPAITQAGTLYTSAEDKAPVSFKRTTGNVALWVKSTAGSITISQQVSLDGTVWLDPRNSAKAIIGNVYSALGITTGIYIVFSPVVAPYIRFKIVEQNVGATTVTMKLVMQEEIR